MMNLATWIILGYLLTSLLCTIVLMSAFIVGGGHDKAANAMRASDPHALVTLQQQLPVYKWTQREVADEAHPTPLTNLHWPA